MSFIYSCERRSLHKSYTFMLNFILWMNLDINCPKNLNIKHKVWLTNNLVALYIKWKKIETTIGDINRCIGIKHIICLFYCFLLTHYLSSSFNLINSKHRKVKYIFCIQINNIGTTEITNFTTFKILFWKFKFDKHYYC